MTKYYTLADSEGSGFIGSVGSFGYTAICAPPSDGRNFILIGQPDGSSPTVIGSNDPSTAYYNGSVLYYPVTSTQQLTTQVEDQAGSEVVTFVASLVRDDTAGTCTFAITYSDSGASTSSSNATHAALTKRKLMVPSKIR